MPDETLQFAVGDQTVSFLATIEDKLLSAHTGKNLLQMVSTLTVHANVVPQVRDLLATPDLTDLEGRLWSGRIETESYSGDGPHQLSIRWSEAERLQAVAVEFEGISLTPARYQEHANGDGTIALSFQAALSQQEADAIRDLQARHVAPPPPYFDVVRQGVSDQPRRVRLGRVLWQPRENGEIDHEITLVDEAHDASPESFSFLALAGEPQGGHVRDAVATLTGQMDALLAALDSNGTLTSASIADIRSQGDEARRTKQHLFYKVSNVSRWWNE